MLAENLCQKYAETKNRRVVMCYYFGHNIALLRKYSDLTQEAFAKKYGYSRSTIAGWEKEGKLPSIEDIEIIADSFKMKADRLLHDKLTERDAKYQVWKISDRKPKHEGFVILTKEQLENYDHHRALACKDVASFLNEFKTNKPSDIEQVKHTMDLFFDYSHLLEEYYLNEIFEGEKALQVRYEELTKYEFKAPPDFSEQNAKVYESTMRLFVNLEEPAALYLELHGYTLYETGWEKTGDFYPEKRFRAPKY